MTNADVSPRIALGPHLPYLRRYARALTGSQQSGDNYVRAALEMAVESPDCLTDIHAPRFALFRLFHAFWNPHRDTGATLHEVGSNGGLPHTGAKPFS
jgi:hypothetical protein